MRSGAGNGIRERGLGNLEIFLSEEKLASKDRAESPTALPERPDKDNSQQTTDNRLLN